MKLLLRIECHLKRTAMTPTRFGRDAVGDPKFVLDLRQGRDPTDSTIARVTAWLDREEGEAACRG